MSNAASNGHSENRASYFEQQRALILQDIGENLEQVLQNLNKLNRNLEGVVAVGNEFSSVEALWSHFEGVMAKEQNQDNDDKQASGDATGEHQTASAT